MRLALFFLLLWNTASTTFSFHLRRRVDEQDPAMMHMVDRTQGGTMPPNASPGDVVPPHTDDFATDDAAVTDDDELEKIEEGKSDVDVTLELEPNPEVPTTESFNQQFDDDDQNQNDDDQNQNDDANNIGPTDDAIDKNDDDNFADGSGNSPEKVRIDDDSFGDEQKSQVDVGDIRDQYQSDEDKKVRELGGLGILFGLLAMIFTVSIDCDLRRLKGI